MGVLLTTAPNDSSARWHQNAGNNSKMLARP